MPLSFPDRWPVYPPTDVVNARHESLVGNMPLWTSSTSNGFGTCACNPTAHSSRGPTTAHSSRGFSISQYIAAAHTSRNLSPLDRVFVIPLLHTLSRDLQQKRRTYLTPLVSHFAIA